MIDRSFWQDLWQQHDTPWTGERVNDVLKDFLPRLRDELGIAPPARALVPLCGDSPAVRMLYEAGYDVTGVEFVSEAIEQLAASLFADVPLRREAHALVAPRIALLERDFLTFSAPAEYMFVYDRAGYVALGPVERRRYAAVIIESLRPGGALLSRTSELLGAPWQGPPFSVDFAEVRDAFAPLELIAHTFEDVAPTQQRFLDAGISSIRHVTCVMRRA